jgi:energy-coupling factor transporter ATP-binding protein EcfA2
MRMLRFRVVGFRSVRDSGWIDVDDVTALIGENESGKTNLLVPLWKLNPASDGDIDLVDDFPRNRYHEAHARKQEDLPVFIQADFALSPDAVTEIVALTESPLEDVSVARVSRNFGGGYVVAFPNAKGSEGGEWYHAAELLTKGRERIALAETDS